MRRHLSSGTASSDASSTLEPQSPVDDVVSRTLVDRADGKGTIHDVREVQVVR